MGLVLISITFYNWSAFLWNVVTKVIPTANRGKENSFKSQKELMVETTKLPKARENACVQVVNGFSLPLIVERMARVLWTNRKAK